MQACKLSQGTHRGLPGQMPKKLGYLQKWRKKAGKQAKILKEN